MTKCGRKMAACMEEAGARCGQIGWECAYELCSFHSVELHLPLIMAVVGKLQGRAGWCWKKLKNRCRLISSPLSGPSACLAPPQP